MARDQEVRWCVRVHASSGPRRCLSLGAVLQRTRVDVVTGSPKRGYILGRDYVGRCRERTRMEETSAVAAVAASAGAAFGDRADSRKGEAAAVGKEYREGMLCESERGHSKKVPTPRPRPLS